MSALLRSLFAASAALAFPALASAAEVPGAARTGAAIERYPATRATAGGTPVICIRTGESGWRVDRHVCRTEADWEARGARVERATRRP